MKGMPKPSWAAVPRPVAVSNPALTLEVNANALVDLWYGLGEERRLLMREFVPLMSHDIARSLLRHVILPAIGIPLGPDAQTLEQTLAAGGRRDARAHHHRSRPGSRSG